jgi:hypothetical protein
VDEDFGNFAGAEEEFGGFEVATPTAINPFDCPVTASPRSAQQVQMQTVNQKVETASNPFDQIFDVVPAKLQVVPGMSSAHEHKPEAAILVPQLTTTFHEHDDIKARYKACNSARVCLFYACSAEWLP